MLNIKPCLLVVCLFGVAISAQRTILEMLRNTPELSCFNQYIGSPSNARLYNMLADPNANMTMFAPVNEGCEQWRQLLMGSNTPWSDMQMSNALNFHVIPQQLIMNRDLNAGYQQYQTLYNPYDTMGYSRGMGMNRVGSFEVPQDLTSGLTIFGKSGNVAIFRGAGIPAHFVRADIAVSNGIIHTIDQLLTPPLSIWNTLQMRGLTRVMEAIRRAKAMDTFRSLNRVTLLVPTNEAWGQFLDMHGDMTPDMLRNVLLTHIIPGSYLSQDLMTRPAFRVVTRSGETIQIACNAQKEITVGDADIVMPDILTDRAVMHVINKVLMPGELSSQMY